MDAVIADTIDDDVILECLRSGQLSSVTFVTHGLTPDVQTSSVALPSSPVWVRCVPSLTLSARHGQAAATGLSLLVQFHLEQTTPSSWSLQGKSV